MEVWLGLTLFMFLSLSFQLSARKKKHSHGQSSFRPALQQKCKPEIEDRQKNLSP